MISQQWISILKDESVVTEDDPSQNWKQNRKYLEVVVQSSDCLRIFSTYKDSSLSRLQTNICSPENLVHDAAEDGVLHCGEHKLHVVRVSGDGDVRVDLGPAQLSMQD